MELTAVKARLEHGQFLPWIKAEFDMGQQTADRIMHVADRFGGKLLKLSNFKPSIFYALAALFTPEPAILKAIEKAAP